MTQREGETCLYNELLPRLSCRLMRNSLALQWLTSGRLLAIFGSFIVAAGNSIRPMPSFVVWCLFSSVAPFVIATVGYCREAATYKNSTDFSITSSLHCS